MTGLRAEMIELDTVDGPMATYVAHPDGEPLGGVVVVQEAFGLTGHIRGVAESLARAGFLAVAPALFHQCEPQVFGYEDYQSLGPVIMTMTAESIGVDVDAALAELDRLGVPPTRRAIIGFCFGGTVALATAARLPLAAAVTFYGGGLAEGRFGLSPGIETAAELQTPWLGLYGDLDAHIPIDDVEKLRLAARGSGVETEVVRFADADHGFHCEERASFHAASSADAWQRTIGFLTAQMR